jgi:Na+/melibiose symporter-like transporter
VASPVLARDPAAMLASAASASARCSGRGRDTSLARMAALGVSFMAGTASLLSPSSHHRARTVSPVHSPPEPITGPAPPGTLWRHRNFLLLWAGQSVSEMGSAVTQLALPLTAVVILQASTFQVGLLTSAATAAFALIALPAGALVDRWAKRWLMIWCDASPCGSPTPAAGRPAGGCSSLRSAASAT